MPPGKRLEGADSLRQLFLLDVVSPDFLFFMTSFPSQLIRTNIRAALALALLVLVGYSPMLASPFKTLDDDYSIVHNQDLRSFRSLPRIFASTYFGSQKDYYRPLVYVSYMAEYRCFGLRPFFFNLDNVLLHAVNAFLVFLLALALLGDRPRAFAVAVLFAVHPVQWEAVANISGRAILLCSFFVLSGWLFFLRFLRQRRFLSLAAAAGCYLLGLLCKESAGVLMLGAAGYLLIVERYPWRRLPVLWPMLLATGAVFWVRHQIGVIPGNPWPNPEEMILGVAAFVCGTLTWVRVLAFPADLHFDRAQVIYRSLFHPHVLAAVAVYTAAGAALWRYRRRLPPLMWFCLLWLALELLPVSQIVTSIGVYPGAISLAEHFLYMAVVPVFILAVMGVDRLYVLARGRGLVTPSGAMSGIGLFVAFLFLVLVQQAVYAGSEFLMVRRSLEIEPRNDRLQYSLGRLYMDTGQPELAVAPIKRAMGINPMKGLYHVALGRAWEMQGDYLRAIRAYELAPVPDEERPILDQIRQDVFQRLVREYEGRLRAAPDDLGLRFSLGVFYEKLGRHAEAYDAFSVVAAHDQTRWDALFNMGVTAEALAAPDKARDAWTRLTVVAPPGNEFRRLAEARLVLTPLTAGE